MKTPRIKKVVPNKDFTLTLTYSNGEARLFNITPYLHLGVFRALTDMNLFLRAGIGFNTVAWPQNIDIAPETLYLESRPLP